MIKVKDNVNLLELLKKKGLTTYVMRRDRIMGESRIHRLRHGELPSWRELDIICRLTDKNVGDLIEYESELPV